MDDKAVSHPDHLPGGHRLAVRGSRLAVYYVRSPNGRFPAQEFLNGCKPTDRAKFLRLMQKRADGHPMKDHEYDTFADMGGLWELKIWGSRLVGFYGPGGRAYLTHGFSKRKEGATKPSDLEPAVRLRATFS